MQVIRMNSNFTRQQRAQLRKDAKALGFSFKQDYVFRRADGFFCHARLDLALNGAVVARIQIKPVVYDEIAWIATDVKSYMKKPDILRTNWAVGSPSYLIDYK